jgi:hypothetical protein
VRRHYRDTCASLDLLGTKALVPLETLYQELPLLREVQRERLPREPQKPRQNEDDKSRSSLGAAEILRWEEHIRDEQVTYLRHSLDELFADFPRVILNAASAVPRFIVLGPPRSGKTTLQRVLAYRAAVADLRFSGRRLLPVGVRLREWEACIVNPRNPEASLPEYMAKCHKNLHSAATAEQWKRWLL